MSVAADIGQDLPAALALLALCRFKHHPHPRHVRQPERRHRGGISRQRDARGDAQIGERRGLQRRQHRAIFDMHHRGGFE